MRSRILIVFILLLSLSSTASAAQFNFVDQFLNRYRPSAAPPQLEPQSIEQAWQAMVRSGQLPISINDVIRLMLQSNLDISLQRLTPFERRILIDSLFTRFEPTLDITAATNRNTQPTATALDAGVNSTLAHFYTIGYGQTLQGGTRVDVDLTVRRSSTNNPFATFNPSYSSSLVYQVSQPLLRNFGRDINITQIRVARNNASLSEIDFEMQVINLVNQAQNLYWDLVSQREDIRVRNTSLQLAERTLADNKRKVEIGTMAPIDIVQAESEVAQRQEQMVTGSYLADQTQDRIKRLMTNLGDPALVLAKLDPVEQLRRPATGDTMSIEEAIKYALESRPEMRRYALQLQNADMNLKFDKNQLLPQFNVFASYTQSGVGGTEIDRNTRLPVRRGGLTDAFSQTFGYDFTGYQIGFTVSINLSNKSAQAAYTTDLVQKRSIEAARTAQAQAIALEVRNAHSVLDMNKARIEAAQKALQLANLQLEAEQKKFQLGTTEVRFVLEAQRTVAQQQTNEIASLVNYAKALVEYDRSLGRTLRKNSVEIDKTLQIAVHPVSGSDTARPAAAQQ
ncbi:MAG: TolC family protein [Acidobacteria bacterium]|nr:TolC family protein [Acidobacteriota bacterium]